MTHLNLNKKMAQLALLQRIELASPFQKKLRKILKVFIFKFYFKAFNWFKKISRNYTILMRNELSTLKKFLSENQNILSIGGGIGGLKL